MEEINSTILTKETNELALKLTSFRNLNAFDHIVRFNYYSIILIKDGGLNLKIGLGEASISPNIAICVSPYQSFMMTSEEQVHGYMLNFHPDFFCTYRHQNEIETEGILFNNFSSVPYFPVSNLSSLINDFLKMNSEILENQVGIHEVLISALKIFLIKLIREKGPAHKTSFTRVKEKPLLLQKIADCIEMNYKELHTAGEYAKLLFVTPQQLNKIVKSHLNISLSQMIVNRIMIEAKRELYLTSKAVKEISNELGYKDEFYFSRVFKRQVGVSPKFYRETVGFAKME
ncbi:MAG: AraC family transcriptional regulator [Bacteroidota bacterium]